ncbi:PIG-L family deacetylase [Deltaproteobacteria bacterium OttesenSCG-928-M10]|nr:PIG-L family deacetylase [Deltaproteobacteria bacterium OttesenSCG-928-M10]
MLNIDRILVVAAHPDDEILGCGGTLARLHASGARLHILLLGEGPTSRTGSIENDDLRLAARNSALEAAEIIGCKDVRLAGLPDNRFDTVPLLDLIRIVESAAEEIQPDLVFTHHSGDLNIDHRLTHQATLTAFRPLPGRKPATLLSFEVLSSTEYSVSDPASAFHPSVYVDISGYLQLKQKALIAYTTEMRPWPHPRSPEGVEHLARLRGCQCGVEAAEAFVLIRSVF